MYGRCIIANRDNLEKGSCNKEFQQLMKCFEKVLRLIFVFYYAARVIRIVLMGTGKEEEVIGQDYLYALHSSLYSLSYITS